MGNFQNKNLIFKFFTANRMFLGSVIFTLFSLNAHASNESLKDLKNLELEKCENQAIRSDLEKRFMTLQSQIVENFELGQTKKIRDELLTLRNNLDQLSIRSLDLSSSNSQELNHFVHQILEQFDLALKIVPEMKTDVARVKKDYVTPFQNINNEVTINQDCMMELAVLNAQNDKDDKDRSQASQMTSLKSYQILSQHFDRLNQNAFLIESYHPHELNQIKIQLSQGLELFNNGRNKNFPHSLPLAINSLQEKLEKLLPGLQISQSKAMNH